MHTLIRGYAYEGSLNFRVQRWGGQSVTAIHLATFFSEFGQTLLIDGNPNGNAIAWAEQGKLPFQVVDRRAR